MADFEETFQRMQEARQNDIVHITNWMRDVSTYYTNLLWFGNNVPNTSSNASSDDLNQERDPSLSDISLCDSEESANIVNEETYPESKFKRLFDGLDTAKIELNKFYEILGRVAEERRTNLESLKKMLVSGPNKYYKAMKEGYSAFSKSLKKGGVKDHTEKEEPEIITADAVVINSVLKKSGSEFGGSEADDEDVTENVPHNVRINSVERVQIIESLSSKHTSCESASKVGSIERCSENLEKDSLDIAIEKAPVKKRK